MRRAGGWHGEPRPAAGACARWGWLAAVTFTGESPLPLGWLPKGEGKSAFRFRQAGPNFTCLSSFSSPPHFLPYFTAWIPTQALMVCAAVTCANTVSLCFSAVARDPEPR